MQCLHLRRVGGPWWTGVRWFWVVRPIVGHLQTAQHQPSLVVPTTLLFRFHHTALVTKCVLLLFLSTQLEVEDAALCRREVGEALLAGSMQGPLASLPTADVD